MPNEKGLPFCRNPYLRKNRASSHTGKFSTYKEASACPVRQVYTWPESQYGSKEGTESVPSKQRPCPKGSKALNLAFPPTKLELDSDASCGLVPLGRQSPASQLAGKTSSSPIAGHPSGHRGNGSGGSVSILSCFAPALGGQAASSVAVPMPNPRFGDGVIRAKLGDAIDATG